MEDPFVGEIKMFAGNFAPRDWAICAGQLLSIAEYSVLFSLIGTTYGGDGMSNFALPDLRGRAPVHQGSLGGTNFSIGENGGSEEVTLTANQLPAHRHNIIASNNFGESIEPEGKLFAKNPDGVKLYNSTVYNMSPDSGGSLVPFGSSGLHNNLAPYFTINFIIALEGIFPPRT